VNRHTAALATQIRLTLRVFECWGRGFFGRDSDRDRGRDRDSDRDKDRETADCCIISNRKSTLSLSLANIILHNLTWVDFSDRFFPQFRDLGASGSSGLKPLRRCAPRSSQVGYRNYFLFDLRTYFFCCKSSLRFPPSLVVTVGRAAASGRGSPLLPRAQAPCRCAPR